MKRYIITGASRGIGRALAEHLAHSSIHLYLIGRDSSALEEVKTTVEGGGGRAQIVEADLSAEEGIAAVKSAVGDHSIEVLINNAGIAVVKPVEEISKHEWQETIATNITAPFRLIQTFAPTMPRGASIVNILSVAATQGFPTWSSYCMSKFALDGLSRAVREEYRERGVRVITVTPAATGSDIWQSIPGDWPVDKMMKPTEVAKAVGYALNQPSDVVVDSLVIGKIGGNL